MTGQHYFSSTSVDPALVSTSTVRLAGRDLRISSAPGVFSAGRLDLGTRVLLREVPAPPPEGILLDLGCGWGPLALSMAIASPAAQVWAVDVNPRALDLVRRSATDAGVRSIVAATPDEVPETVRFDAIWSNPPIRIGKQALNALLMRWLPRLADGACGYLVVQRNLGADSLITWLGGALPDFAVAKIASAKGYRVIEVRRPGG